ncbi:hypothetical protein HDV05_002128, partial [Chytridiales sp. JEL 0842]
MAEATATGAVLEEEEFNDDNSRTNSTSTILPPIFPFSTVPEPPYMPDPTTPLRCEPLESSSICTSWPQAKVFLPSDWSLINFDTTLTLQLQSPQFVADFNRHYGCAWDGVGMRYAMTWACAHAVFSVDARCNEDWMDMGDKHMRYSDEGRL